MDSSGSSLTVLYDILRLCDRILVFLLLLMLMCGLVTLLRRLAALSLSLPLSDDVTVSLIPQFGTSFATFRPAFSHSGSTRPLSVILPVPASPPYIRPSGSGSSSPTSKVPMWKVCSPLASMS